MPGGGLANITIARCSGSEAAVSTGVCESNEQANLGSDARKSLCKGSVAFIWSDINRLAELVAVWLCLRCIAATKQRVVAGWPKLYGT